MSKIRSAGTAARNGTPYSNRTINGSANAARMTTITTGNRVVRTQRATKRAASDLSSEPICGIVTCWTTCVSTCIVSAPAIATVYRPSPAVEVKAATM